jgi:hypothetical protein
MYYIKLKNENLFKQKTTAGFIALLWLALINNNTCKVMLRLHHSATGYHRQMSLGPLALRPCFSTGLPFSGSNYFI